MKVSSVKYNNEKVKMHLGGIFSLQSVKLSYLFPAEFNSFILFFFFFWKKIINNLTFLYILLTVKSGVEQIFSPQRTPSLFFCSLFEIQLWSTDFDNLWLPVSALEWLVVNIKTYCCFPSITCNSCVFA